MSTIFEQLQNIRASLSLRTPSVLVARISGQGLQAFSMSHQNFVDAPIVTINDTDELLKALAERLEHG